MANYIRFDWAMKRLLRNKANYAVLEGFMCSLLNEKFKINRFLDSESNQQTENDKFNRVDILAENEKGEFIIFEIQNTREHTYFHRMLYGVSKVITDNISLGDDYDKVRKVYSINIVYFTLGQAKDYVYHGKTMFQGLHQPNDILKLLIDTDERIRWNFIQHLSRIDIFLSQKMRMLSLFSVKEKVAQYLIKMATEQQSRTIRLDVSRQEMADIFGIQKFSLLRCLSEFEEKGAIRIEGKTITILNSDEMK